MPRKITLITSILYIITKKLREKANRIGFSLQ